jgi:uncharacterized RDD family membrane protein YckC
VATDKLIIDTPEQVHLEFALANIGSRFMAVFADTAIQFVLYLILLILDETVLGGAMFSKMASYQIWVVALLIFIYFCIYWGYFAVFEAIWNGQTPGKRWAGIRVIKDSGRPINVFEAIARNFLRIVDSIPFIYVVGIVTILLNSRNRRLGDFVAGTLVVHERKANESELFFNTPARTTDVALYQAAKLSIQEIELIETFLARRLDIPPEVRQLHGRRIAEMIGSKLGIEEAARPAGHEDFLELVVKEFRSRAHYQ